MHSRVLCACVLQQIEAYVAELKARAPTRRRSAASASLFPAGCEPTIGSSLVSLEVASPARRVIQPDQPDKEQDCRVAEPNPSILSDHRALWVAASLLEGGG